MEYWNMTEQIPQTIQVALTKRKRDIEYGNQKIKFITITENRFFGETKQKVKDSTYKIASKEKTILDGLTYPQHCAERVGRLSGKEFRYSSCGLVMHADRNGAINIKDRGLDKLGIKPMSESGASLAMPETPEPDINYAV